jgi:hypothetical protein
MAGVSFSSRLQEDGSLIVPQDAATKLGLHPGDEVDVSIKPSCHHGKYAEPRQLGVVLDAMTHRTAIQIAEARLRAMNAYKPVRSLPRGTVLVDVVSGKWPGEESDEQIDAAIGELS